MADRIATSSCISPTVAFSAPRDFTIEMCSSRWTNAQTLSTCERVLIRALPVLPPAPVTRIIIALSLTYSGQHLCKTPGGITLAQIRKVRLPVRGGERSNRIQCDISLIRNAEPPAEPEQRCHDSTISTRRRYRHEA